MEQNSLISVRSWWAYLFFQRLCTMAVKIRFSRIGKKGIPFYRLIAIDSRKKRDGAFLEDLGTYDTLNAKVVVFHKDRYDAWVAQGAQPTDSAKKVYRLYNRSTGNSAVAASVAAEKSKRTSTKKAAAAE